MHARLSSAMALLLVACSVATAGAAFDHSYREYGVVLSDHVVGDRVDYKRLQAKRAALDAVVAELSAVSRAEEAQWTPPQQMAYWINAYNVFTLRAIVDHYPIRGSWPSLYPRNSIRQIARGVDTTALACRRPVAHA